MAAARRKRRGWTPPRMAEGGGPWGEMVHQEVVELRREFGEFRAEMAATVGGLKVKAGVWGLMGGLMVVLIEVGRGVLAGD